jgi:hypothetical protein
MCLEPDRSRRRRGRSRRRRGRSRPRLGSDPASRLGSEKKKPNVDPTSYRVPAKNNEEEGATHRQDCPTAPAPEPKGRYRHGRQDQGKAQNLEPEPAYQRHGIAPFLVLVAIGFAKIPSQGQSPRRAVLRRSERAETGPGEGHRMRRPPGYNLLHLRKVFHNCPFATGRPRLVRRHNRRNDRPLPLFADTPLRGCGSQSGRSASMPSLARAASITP